LIHRPRDKQEIISAFRHDAVAKQVRQLGDVNGNLSRLIFGERFGRLFSEN